jgi:hypothetical protein
MGCQLIKNTFSIALYPRYTPYQIDEFEKNKKVRIWL